MTAIALNKNLARSARLGLLLVAALPLLACDSIEAASKATQRAAYRASFKQVPMITSRGEPGRVLNMYVFENGAVQKVPFHAQLSP